MSNLRVGLGYDVHQLVAGRELVLGGVSIPHLTGLLGHSDADVVTHAIIDALLGAARLGDIGRHFPDSDPAYSGISSLLLLREAGDLVRRAGYALVNLDAVIMAEAPRLAEYLPEMEQRIAEALNAPTEAVALQATTTEGLGPVGRREGIAAQAVALLEKI
jgi:2-C-methyl-D-erythritol 2,4-cyclodiphosphate synthase